ncbi:chemotaxis protein CheD [Symbiobacterium thermophilum]|uniref:Probable chemoreceptor glutamine deamidase CheD n=3 Tax=Symbiobacterium thermophilum TaxID=2734 RepID=CHED_SYMTH|nr:chemotaxis protein CheD [Symbiobacterium thermophilum]Q67P69.1 RecName: Full=Probable chemoreceptor glutamine deamidase CheD [Symbiobacterium thermophilum IAM 14863]MBY6276992.1 chemoreceptor glutamine deamidase CheD [Symbiobacterium thermophilum]BAD40524.1 chemotaxis methylation protein [Symbiobacterium thermophilum IAM 14863]
MSDRRLEAVGLGELKVADRPDQVLVCYGLGSCVGLALYDPVVRIGAMVHVVLPDSSMGRGREAPPGKYADTGVEAAVAALVDAGASRSRLIAKAAGGARMLRLAGSNPQLDIGARNTEAVRAALARHQIRLVAEDMGGTYGRTLQLFIETGRVLVSTVGRGEHEL